jgi:hypothetical protein
MISDEVPQNLASMEGCVILKVVNQGDHSVNVTSVGFYLQDKSRRKMPLTVLGSGVTLPGMVPAHNEGFAYITESSPEGELLDLHPDLNQAKTGLAHFLPMFLGSLCACRFLRFFHSTLISLSARRTASGSRAMTVR